MPTACSRALDDASATLKHVINETRKTNVLLMLIFGRISSLTMTSSFYNNRKNTKEHPTEVGKVGERKYQSWIL